MHPTLEVTRDPAAVRAAQALRHAVFVEELGARTDGPAGWEADAFDAHSDHLILRDGDGVAGTTRIGRGEGPGFYVEREFDLSALRASGRRMAEMGRTCLRPDHRGGAAAALMFAGLLDHLAAEGVEVLVGVGSFHGADPVPRLPALACLEARALAPRALRPVATGPSAVFPEGPADAAAMRDVPGLIKTYLRAGAWVGRGAWVDRPFNTVDVCLVLDLARVRRPRALG
ncbi:GNAT family N-acetyltransferase [Jannaschia sp. Os4]|uniref:GNAT family N-acetyltransferase n=1 Tax=Jannaschia sp. Os4 TaxID=2807617 RepID=UPI001939A051|nr:GNAT family N-acetyltransferase [Jannaschia sp. Os4]MBM2576605.1 GNAT family N-acetyltransferase [Jannaschia sp. Os4]